MHTCHVVHGADISSGACHGQPPTRHASYLLPERDHGDWGATPGCNGDRATRDAEGDAHVDIGVNSKIICNIILPIFFTISYISGDGCHLSPR